MKTKLLITGMAFMAFTTMVVAQEKTTVQTQNAVTQAGSGTYVDANNDGVCDYYETNGRQFNRRGQRMANASATPNRRGMAAGKGRGLRPSQGRGLGPGQGKGAAPGGINFIDEDKNGVCDLRETSPKK